MAGSNNVVGPSQVDVDVISISGDASVIQDAHDELNANANLQVGDVDVANGNPVPVSDAGGSLTVDGTVSVTGLLADGHNVTVDNAAGASAVNIQDGGNSITIDNANLDTPLSTLETSLNAIQTAQLADGHNVTVDNASLAVTGPLTDAELRATDVNVETGLGQAEGTTPVPADVGVAMLGHIEETVVGSGTTDDTYEWVSMNTHRQTRTTDKTGIDLANCNDFTDYTALGNDTTNLADSLDHVFGVGALTFDKVNGADDTVYAGVEQSITATDISELFEDGGFVALGVKLPSIANVTAVFMRVGTDSSNYNEWEWVVDDLEAGKWLALRQATNRPSAYLGNGWGNSISYVAFGVEFNSQSNTLAGIIFDNVHIISGTLSQADINASISSSVSGPNVKINGYSGNVDTNTGNASANTLRVVLPNDQPSVTVDGPLTDTELRATPVPVSGTVSIQEPLSIDDNGGSITVDGTFFQATQPVSAATLPLPSGAATSANQLPDGHNVTVDNASIAITAASLPLPSGAATSANQLADDHNVRIAPLAGLTITETRTTVSTSAASIVASNTGRKYGYIVNSGPTNVFIGFASGVTASGSNIGAKLGPKGSAPIPPGFEGQIWGISDIASSTQNIYVMEAE